MFENLNEIRDAWENNEAIIIDKVDESYLVIPLQLANNNNIKQFFTLNFEELLIIVPFKIQKVLEIPTYETLGRSISSTYPIMTQLFRNNKIETNINYSLRVGPISSDKYEIPKYLVRIGDAFENYMAHGINKRELKNIFYSTSMAPGVFTLVQSSYESLKDNKRIEELAIELASIAKYPGGLLATKIPDAGVLDLLYVLRTKIKKLHRIEEKTIINLWRSVNKIQKEEIRYLE